MRILTGLFCVFCFSATAHPANAAGDVVLFGGGARPAAALARLMTAAGGAGHARFLVVAWASADPADTSSGVRAELLSAGAHDVRSSLASPTDEPSRARLREELDWATGIFFSGGDQLRLLDAVERTPGFRERVLARWDSGAALAGTSAGTAALSERVFTGNEDLTVIDPSRIELRAGFGVLKDVIFDQHFLVRQRENRLFSAVLRYPGSLGVGIDEDNALVLEGSIGRVVGPTSVMVVEHADPRLSVSLLHQGQCWDFRRRLEIACP